MKDTARQDDAASGLKWHSRPRVCAAVRAVAVMLLVIPIAGIVAHVALLVWASLDQVVAYYRSGAMMAVFVLPWIVFAASFVHQKRTGMRINIAARVACFLWLASILVVVPGIFRMLRGL